MNTVISFSLPAHLAMRLNEENIPARTKSQWISDAIRSKLDTDSLGTISRADKEGILRWARVIVAKNDQSLAMLITKHLDDHILNIESSDSTNSDR
jgi:metal-responsive CopG/Arc/MetJ family transcriptional regulator